MKLFNTFFSLILLLLTSTIITPNTQQQIYDFIIVGGGTSGCVLAEKLSRCEEFTVLLIEGGLDHEKQWAQEYQTSQSYNVQNARSSCIGTYFDGYLRLAGGTNKPRKAVLTKYGFAESLGGLSAINDQIITRGAQATWDAIGNDLDWKSVLPHFKNIENAISTVGFNTIVRGSQGHLVVRSKTMHDGKDHLTPIKNSLSSLLNQPLIEDYNNGKPAGLSEAQYAVTEFSSSSAVYGKRETTYQRFLVESGAVKRPNLSIINGHKVLKVEVEQCNNSKRVTGVIIQTSKGLETIRARKEIILSAGALNTPVILLQSGIGSSCDLSDVGVKQVAEVPGVGHNLHDHLHIGNVLFNDRTSYPAGYRPPQLLLHAHSGVNRVEPVDAPDLEYVLTPQILDSTGKIQWLIDIYITRHSLRGQLAIASKVPGLQPRFPRPAHLPYAEGSSTFYSDLQPVLIKAVKLLEPLLDSPLLTYCPCPIGDDFKQISLTKNQTDEQILEQFNYFFKNCTIENLNALGASLFVANRFGGSCKIGSLNDPLTVVGKDFKVRGFDNLRIADASILPIPLQSHMDAPLMMLGHKVGSMLCKEHQETYDFIIVGSGCAGTILLSRLTEDPSIKVLCVDAGNYYQTFDETALSIDGRTIDNLIPPQAIIDHLGGWQRYHPSEHGFGLKTPTQTYSNRVRSTNLFGGGSTINSSDYWRGEKWIFDYWASPTGLNLHGWSWNDVAPLHEKIEYTLINDGNSLRPINPADWPGRGTQGPIAVQISDIPKLDPAQPSVPEQIGAALGLPFFKDYQVPHYDSHNKLITQFVSLAQHNRTRVVTGYCDDKNIFQRNNLTILFKSPVARILFNEKGVPDRQLSARGIVTMEGKIYYARKEVIINCGAIISPKLLMLSGIGDAQALSKHGIQPLLNLPAVGKNLADHISPQLEPFNTTSLTNYASESPLQMKALLQTAASPLNNWPDTEISIGYKRKPDSDISSVWMGCYGHLSPIYGEISLRSSDPQVDPEITGVHEVFDSMGNIRADVAPQWIGLYRIWLKLFLNLKGTLPTTTAKYSQTTLFIREGNGHIKENPTDQEILDAYRIGLSTTPSLFRYKSVYDKGHFMGTCRMGNKDIDPHAVVDNNFMVYGTNNLRVIDNSIIPSTPDGKQVVSPFGHPAAWLYMFGEKVSALIKAKYAID